MHSLESTYVCLFLWYILWTGVHQANYTMVAQEFPTVRLGAGPPLGVRMTMNPPWISPEGCSVGSVIYRTIPICLHTCCFFTDTTFYTLNPVPDTSICAGYSIFLLHNYIFTPFWQMPCVTLVIIEHLLCSHFHSNFYCRILRRM